MELLHTLGICFPLNYFQVIPPKEWIPRKSYEDVDITIPTPILQVVTGTQGERCTNNKVPRRENDRDLTVKLKLNDVEKS